MWLRLKRRVIRLLITLVVRIFLRVEVQGMEKIHAVKGKAIVACNHLGRMDAAMPFALVNRDDLIIVVAEKYRKQAFFRFLVKQLDLLWLERYEADFGTLKEVLRRLERGGILIIAPEGTRSPTGTLLEGKPGVAFIAAKSGAVVIPAGVTGTEDSIVAPQFRRFRRPLVRIVVGDPFVIPPIPKTGRDEFFKAQTDEIMARIALLLPMEYRGVYKDHPRVVELSFSES